MVAIPPDRPIETRMQTVLEPMVEPQPASLALPSKPVFFRTREEVCSALTRAAEKNDLPVPFFIRLLFQESEFKPDLVSSAGAQGVAQFMPETAASVGLDNPFDPLQAIPASARLLRRLFHRFGNLGLAAAAYNAGPKRIEAWQTKKGTLPQETQGYVKTITGRPAEQWNVAEAGTPAPRSPRHAPCQEAAGLHAWNGPEQIPMPVPSPLVAAAQQAPIPRAETKHAARVALLAKAAKKSEPAQAKQPGKPVIQLAARKRLPAPIGQKLQPKPLRLAAATRAAHK